MEILNMRVNWMLGYLNNPSIEVLVDKIPEDLRYKKKRSGSHTLYWAEKEGYVHFLAHNLNDQTGFYGSKFNLTLEDGTVDTIKGPWSSRSGVFNNEGFVYSREVAITDDERDFKEHGTFSAGYLTVEKLKEGLSKFMPDLVMVRVLEHNEIYFNPSPRDALAKNSDQQKERGEELYPYRPVEHISNPLQEMKNKMAEGLFGMSISTAHEQKICISCKDSIGRVLQDSMNYELDMREWKISGLCPNCFPK